MSSLLNLCKLLLAPFQDTTSQAFPNSSLSRHNNPSLSKPSSIQKSLPIVQGTSDFSPHSSTRISESCSCTPLVSAYIVALFQCFRMVPVLCSSGEGGEQKCPQKNCTPLDRGTIEASVSNGFPT